MVCKILVTGGAGFIGSHLVDALMLRGEYVCVLDNLSSGRMENVKQWMDEGNFRFMRGDLLNPKDVKEAIEDCSVVFHLAADPEVRVGLTNPEMHFKNNICATFNLLEAVRNSKVEAFVFASSSTIYGEAFKIPTPEDYSPLKPISVYGASKLACEALITSYACTYGFRAIILRLANIVGSRCRHGVIYDFIVKLKKNSRELEILGDGTQAKSYLYIDDCLDAMLLAFEKSQGFVEMFNVGSEDQVNVREIAEFVIEAMGLGDVKLRCTGGVNGGRGWKGDVKNMLLDVSRLKALGWRPKYNSEGAVRETVASLLTEIFQGQQYACK